MHEGIRSPDDDPLSQKRTVAVSCRVDQRLWWIVLLGAVEAIFAAVAPWLPDSKGQQAPLFLAWPMAFFFG